MKRLLCLVIPFVVLLTACEKKYTIYFGKQKARATMYVKDANEDMYMHDGNLSSTPVKRYPQDTFWRYCIECVPMDGPTAIDTVYTPKGAVDYFTTYAEVLNEK